MKGMKTVQMILMLVATMFLGGCVIPMPVGGNVNYQSPRGSISIGTVQPAPLFIIPAPGPMVQPSCPANTWFDGRGCKFYVPYQMVPRCFSGGRMINGTWYCMDRLSYSPDDPVQFWSEKPAKKQLLLKEPLKIKDPFDSSGEPA